MVTIECAIDTSYLSRDGSSSCVWSVHANKPISPLEDGFYFEMEVISSGHSGLVGPLTPRIERMC